MRIKSFRKEKSKQYYFKVFDNNGKQIVQSESYKSKEGRDNGVASFKKNSALAEQYERLTAKDGRFYFNVKSPNGQVVGTSIMFKTEEEREAAIKTILDYSSGASKTKVKSASAPASDAKALDDYMPAAFYQDSGTDASSGFDKFQKGVSNLFYFSFRSDDGQVILTSQGYTAEPGRDNGIASVEKNSKIEGRYSSHDDGDKFYFTLKAGNHQEIARSVNFNSEAEMKKAMAIMIAGGGTMVEATKVKSTAKPSSDSKANDDYMALGFYSESGTDTTKGFDKFQKGDDDHHFFSFKSDDGNIVFYSQGYTSEAGRDNGIASVEKNSKTEKRYSTHSEGGKFYFTLKAGNHQEIGRSPEFGSEAEMKRAMAVMIAGGGAMVETTKVKSAAKAKASSGDGLDDYRTFGFYKKSGTDVKNGWDKFYSEEHKEYYFSYKVDGEPEIISEGYSSAAARDNGIASIEKNWNNEKRYKSGSTDSGRYYYAIRAGNNQEIGRSKWFSSEADRDARISWLMKGGLGLGASAAAAGALGVVSSETKEALPEIVEETPVVVESVKSSSRSVSSSESKTEKEDDYLPCKAYEGHDINDKQNNVAFFKHENGQFYFVVYKADESVRLRSEGFGSAKERDVELSGMLKNINNPDMYSSIKSGSYAIHVLKDKDGREVGRSCLEKEGSKPAVVKESSSSVEAVGLATAGAGAVTLASSSEKTSETKVEKEDDYLPCKAYEGHDVNDKQNNVAFFKHENGQFYFVVYKADGSVRLRSEGFGSAKERDVELSGMLKNINNPDMYSSIKSGSYAIHILKDKDGREVGRSCLEKEGSKPALVKETKVVEESSSSVEAVGLATAGAGAVTLASSSEKTSEAKVEKEDDYLPCKEYEGHDVNDKQNNVAFFKHENGQYYFVVYKKNGEVKLRSEGFGSPKERDVELSGMLKNITNKDMYTTIKRGKYSIHILRDKNGREVGRSCLEKEATKAAPIVETATAAAIATTVAAPVVKEVVTRKVVEVEDDYLPCKEYKGHKVTDKKNKIALFKHKNGQHYFVVYKKNGDVKLRSEGFPTPKDREGELKAVIKNLNNSKLYSKIEAQGGKYFINVLKDKNGKEVGRSCLEKVKDKVAPIAAAGAAALAATVVSKKVEVVEEVIEPAPVPVVEAPKKVVATASTKKAAAVGGAKAAAATTAATSSGFNWKWLLPLLLLIPLFFWWKSCNNKASTTAAVTPPPVETKAVKPAPAPEPEPAKVVTPPPAPTCNCSGRSNSIVFNLPSNAIPKSLTRLGTSPEFGNSHGLSPSQFYNKLKTAAGSNAADKRFLDSVFKAMGYGSFSDAKADMFSTTTLDKGTRGNMGFGGSKHRTIYATLNTSGKDLEAFRIKAANGCHLHFMKTCGNHFFFCPN